MARNGPKQIPPLILWIVSKYKNTDSAKAKKDIKDIENSSKNLTGSLTQSFGNLAGFIKGVVGAFIGSEIFRGMTALVNMGEESEKEWKLAKQQAENAGYSWDKVGGKIEKYAAQMMQLGIDDEDTALSVTKLLGVSKDLTTAFALNAVAADLAANKGISLGEATSTVMSIIAGNTRVLKQYGIELREGATPMEALRALLERVKGSASAMATPLNMAKVIIADTGEEIGKKLTPSVYQLAITAAAFINSGAGQALLNFFGFLADSLSGLASILDGSALQNFWDRFFPKNHNEISRTNNEIYFMNQQLEKYKGYIKDLEGRGTLTPEQRQKLAEYKAEVIRINGLLFQANQELSKLYGGQSADLDAKGKKQQEKFKSKTQTLTNADMDTFMKWLKLKPGAGSLDDAAKKADAVADAFSQLNSIINGVRTDEAQGAIDNLKEKIEELRKVVTEKGTTADLEKFNQTAALALSVGTAAIYEQEAGRKISDFSKLANGDIPLYLSKLQELETTYNEMGISGARALKVVQEEIARTKTGMEDASREVRIKISEDSKEELAAKLAEMAKEKEALRKKGVDAVTLEQWEGTRRKAIFEEVSQNWIDKEKEKTGLNLKEIRERVRQELIWEYAKEQADEAAMERLKARLALLDKLIAGDDAGSSAGFSRSLHDELESNIADAIETGFDEGGAAGVEKLGDYIKNKIRKAFFDSVADAVMNTLFGSNLENALKSLFSPTGKAGGGLFGKILGVPQGENDEAGTGSSGGLGSSIQKFMGSTFGKALGGLGMGAMMNGGQLGAGGALGTALGMFLPGLGPMLGGMLGGVVDAIFGGSDKNITVQANEGKIEADYLEANFKEGIITLSSVYKDQTLDPRRETPAPVYSVNVYVEGSVIAERNLGQTIQGAAVEGIKKAEAKVGSWQPSKIKK